MKAMRISGDMGADEGSEPSPRALILLRDFQCEGL